MIILQIQKKKSDSHTTEVDRNMHLFIVWKNRVLQVVEKQLYSAEEKNIDAPWLAPLTT